MRFTAVKSFVASCLLGALSASTASATLYTFEAINPVGNDAVGNIDRFFASFDTVSEELQMEWTLTENNGLLANGFTIVINDGPDPKMDSKELAMLYFDATGAQPQLTAYKYDGTPNITSHTNGPTLLSLSDPGVVSSINQQDNGNSSTFSFTLDASHINNHPVLAGNPNWFGIGFDDTIGVWFHTFPVSTLYDKSGALSNWDMNIQGYFDGSNFQTTEVPEPGTLLLVGTALVGMRLRARAAK